MPSILYEVASRIAYITINREDSLNTLNKETVEQMQKVIEDIQGNPQVGAVIVTGAGNRAFSAGGDLKDASFRDRAELISLNTKLNELFDSIEKLPQPTIAAINGYAFGAGFELALACDIRVAVDQTLMGLPQARIGLIPGAGGTQRLPRLIGESRALDLILTGRRIPSLDAYQYGIVTKVVSHQTLEQEAEGIARGMLENAPIALEQAKYAVKNGMKTDLNSGRKAEKAGFIKTAASEDFIRGLEAFHNKRPADFKGH